MSTSRNRAAVVTLGLLGVVLAVTATADAAPIPPQVMTQPKKASGAAVARPKCAWTGTLPAMPATCSVAAPTGTSGKNPTVAQCIDPTFLAGACGKTDAITKSYCAKVLIDDYCTQGGGKEEELVFPIVNPKKAPPHAFVAGTPSLHIPPGNALGGRQVPYVGLTKNGKAPPSTPNGGTAVSQHTGATAIALSGSGSGTFGTISMGQWIPKMNAVRGSMYSLHQGLVASGGVANAQVEAADTAVFNQFSIEGAWVGNGTVNPTNMAVNSCAEYSYQRWYDYLRFKSAAKTISRDFRGIYALATEPSSPVYLEKAALKQFGTGSQPATWPRAYAGPYDHTVTLPHNAFFAPPAIKVTSQNEAKANAIIARIDKYGTTGPNQYMRAPGGTRFNLHKVLKQQIEARYHLSDDQYDERQARQDRYLELALSRDELEPQLACARLPSACCSVPPNNTPNQLHDLLLKIQGWAYINPDPTKLANWGVDVGQTQMYESWTGIEQTMVAGAAAKLKGSPTGLSGKLPAGAVNGAFKQKSPAGGQATQKSPSAGGPRATWASNTVAGNGTQTCEQSWAAKRGSLEAAVDAVVTQMSNLVIKEWDLGADGCLGEPVGGDLGNSCDWSYQKFAHFATSYFDTDVQSDFERCNDTTQGDFNNLKDPNKQGNLYPCELRHNFSEDQHDVAYFIEATPQRARRFECEGQRGQRDVDSYLKANSAIVNKIPIKSETAIGEGAGDKWTIGDAATFGAFLEFSLGWEMKNGGGNMSDKAWCKPVGSSTMKGTGGFNFFSSRLEVIDGNATAETTADSVYYTAVGRYKDLEHPALWKQLFDDKQRVKSANPALELPGGFAFLGDARADFWTSIGPIPLHIFFGGTAIAGMTVKESGTATNAASCSNTAKPSEQVAYGFNTGVGFEPWARADAYGDASLDVGVAAAGLHIDLLLLRLGLPTTSMVSVDTGAAAGMVTGSSLSVDALSGRVSAYVRVGLPPAAVTYEATLFAWDGIHDSVQLWGSEVTAPMKLISWAAQKNVSTTDVRCASKQNPGIALQRPFCFKNPVAADAEPVASKLCSPYPAETFCDSNMKPYRLRGTPPP